MYNQHPSEHVKGTEISVQQAATFETGVTTKQRVRINFGIPDRKQVEKERLEVFKYVCERTQKSNKSFIFLFDVDSDKITSCKVTSCKVTFCKVTFCKVTFRKVTRVVMRDGIVQGINLNG